MGSETGEGGAATGLEVFAQDRLPLWRPVRQELDRTVVTDLRARVAREVSRMEPCPSGARVAIGVGSRGIDRLAEVVSAVVIEIRRRGAEPFVVPAMGSHGGATSEGQQGVLAEYGVTEAEVGAPVRSSMETVRVGTMAGIPIYFDRLASQADWIIPINRVKPHTDFHGPIESGLCKMITIGFGKQLGADTYHQRGFACFPTLVPDAAEWLLVRLPIPFGIALVENGEGKLAHIEAVPRQGWVEHEQRLLQEARRRMARLLGERIDVLIIDQIGKDISGIGADTNVVNRYYNGPLPATPVIQRIVVRSLTVATAGNASGLGLADVVLARAVHQMDPLKTYMNCITAKTPEGARIPMTVETDRQAMDVALASCIGTLPEDAAVVRIQDTKHLETFWASEPFAEPLLTRGQLQPMGPAQPIAFDAAGMLVEP